VPLFDVVCSCDSTDSYALFRYALYTFVTHVSYANCYAFYTSGVTQLRILYPNAYTLVIRE